jgi:eukaryotic-like serine/threonine-protein kinase
MSHPNLVSIFDIVSTDDGEDVIVMEYVEGENLADRLRRGDKPSVREALAMLDGVAAALDAIHARGIIHRDVKPANVLLGADGVVKLADLGIAAVPDGTQITTGESVLGTFRYMAPEQLEGAGTSSAIDVYALAAVAFELLSGEKARHEPNPLALAHAIATQPPPDLRKAWPAAPRAAAQLLTRGMSRDPKLRPRTAGELTAGLRAALAPEPIPAPRARRSRAGLVAALATALAAAAIAAIVLTTLGGRSNQRLAGRSVRAAVSGATSSRSRSHTQKQSKAKPPATTASKQSASSSGQSASPPTPASSGQSASPPPPTPASSGQSAPPPTLASGASPAYAVESFYHLAASHQYAAAWSLADPAFRQQMQGYGGLEGTMAQTRSITFDGVDVVNQSPSTATVAVRTTSVRTDGVQNCSGTVNLLHAGSGSSAWLLDHISIDCA